MSVATDQFNLEGCLKGSAVSVIGAARSGVDAARALHSLGANVTLSDSKNLEQLDPECAARISQESVRFAPGATTEIALPADTELVVTSPGVPVYADVLKEAVRRSIPVWSEIELAYRISPCRIIAITGTNGKTTTALLTRDLLLAGGLDAVVAGNISADETKRTLVDAAFEARTIGASERILVAEVSSFQLEWVEAFAPWIAMLTNITPDHLNRHASFEEYSDAKARLFAAQTACDWAFLNADDPAATSMGQRLNNGRRLWISALQRPSSPAAYMDDGVLTVDTGNNCPVQIVAADEMPAALPGLHSIQNALLAAAAAIVAGVDPGAIRAAIVGFHGVPHRMEIVAEVRGVRFINNSMCTNVAAAIASLEAVGRPAILIAGGADKNMDFAPLARAVQRFTRKTYLIGAAADKMETALRDGGCEGIVRCGSLESAVVAAAAEAKSGDAVILSPACASFDMFKDFEARGASFRSAVKKLGNGGTQ